MAHSLPPEHFLSLPRPGVSHLGIVPDTSTLAAHDFDVDVRTGFLPPQPPPSRLPEDWEQWERVLEDAIKQRLKLGERKDLTTKDKKSSENWRQTVKDMPILPTEGLTHAEVTLRRAHHVLTFILHFYIHTLPPVSLPLPVRIPPSVSIPLLEVSNHLALPPILTFADNVLYNWELNPPQSPFATVINPAHLRSQTTFTGTPDEEHFYLTSSRIELIGVSALALLRSTLDEAFVGDLLSLRRISEYLTQLVDVIDRMKEALNDVRKHCNPAVFYEEIRPWFRGQGNRPWIFDGAEDANLAQPTELVGPSAGQSSIIHVLDIFLGVDQFSHTHVPGGVTPAPLEQSEAAEKELPYLERMQKYMPRHHRAFLNHLKANPRPLRELVVAESSYASPDELEIRKNLKEAYNASVSALKRFRDAHILVATLYIITQARRVHVTSMLQDGSEAERTVQEATRGTGGTDLVPFLKGVRDNTAAAVLKK